MEELLKENEALAKRIIDGYDDEEYRDEAMQSLVAELDQGNFENVKAALKELCSRVEIQKDKSEILLKKEYEYVL